MKLEQSRRIRSYTHNGHIAEGVRNAERGKAIVISRSETIEFRTMAQAAEYIGCSKQLVSQVLNPKTHNKKARGWSVSFAGTEDAE